MTLPGRNDPCHCGSGNKYKKCCLAKDDGEARAAYAAAEAQRRKTLTEEEPVEETDSPQTPVKPSPQPRPFDVKSAPHGNQTRSGRIAKSTGRSCGSGHR